jgi:serine protease Do
MAFQITEAIRAQIQGPTASGLAERLRQSSVQIGDGHGGGSGIIWESDAAKSVIITNAHVVRGRRSFVTLRDGRSLEGRVSKLDERRDLAALAIDAGGLPAATIGDSDSLRVGELVFAMGNPLGLVGALSVGIVHANGKQRANGNQWIGADVRLAPGNSGGMLADAEGRVVGVNSMVAGGLALAIPSNAVKRFLSRAARPRLGIEIRPVPAPHHGADALGLLIFDIQRESAAEKSGLMIGDLILGTREGERESLFTDPNELGDALESATADGRETLELSLIRGGKVIHWPVTFQKGNPTAEAV